MADRTELLRQVPLFADLERKELEQIAASMKERTFTAGQEITEEGEHGVGFFVIEDGEAAVTVRGEPRATLRRGDYFGEIALIAQSDRTATVRAETELRCLGMTFWQFRPLVESNGTLAWRLLQALAKKLHSTELSAQAQS
jgi:CRP/FNR family cyclic AMP-dependent transcriptional regulator